MQKRNKHKTNVKFKGNTPKSDGFTHMIGNAFYHPTKGWRKARKEHHFFTLNCILKPYGVNLKNPGYSTNG